MILLSSASINFLVPRLPASSGSKANIKYVYSMKTPMDVVHLEEFNKRAKFNPKIHKIKTTYSPEQCCIGSTLTGAPCVVKSSIGGKLCYRLMWRDI